MTTKTKQPEPKVDRPDIPQGYGVPKSKKEMLPWSWARERLERATGYWLITSRADGHPHAIPTWGAWVDDRFYCEGSPQTRYGRNIARDPRVVVHLESVDEVVIVEGRATVLQEIDAAKSDRIQAGYAKYKAKGYTADPAGWPGGLWEVVPTVARGWAQFPRDVTRWTFEER
jgi:nitroimidazol reductase NimA-like FMN-containing flavoprotein (pyridoxamine 5'-phosphate oxidase superfamily)